MHKFIIWTLTLPVVVFLLAASIAIPHNRHARAADMPGDILYEILANKNIWPDRFYSFSYSTPESRTLHMDNYWTFEPGKHPLAGPMWIYHPFALDMTDVDITVNQVTR